jgi:hypothetical protein
MWKFGIAERFSNSSPCDMLRAFVRRGDARVVGPVRY